MDFVKRCSARLGFLILDKGKNMRVVLAILVMVVVFPVLARAEMVLRSADVVDGGTLANAQVFNSFGCTGENKSPALSWDGVPEGTKSLAITVYDPDAPTGSGWWHWVAFNIPVGTTMLEAGASLTSMPEGVIESRTDYGVPGFGGACPPEGDESHRYIFTLHALNVEKLDLDVQASGAMVGYFLGAHSLGTASITATYGR